MGKDTISHLESLLSEEVDIEWEIQTDKTIIAHGQASGTMLQSVWGGGRVRRVLGEFDCKEGVNYFFKLKINKDAPNLFELDPHILIEPDGELYKIDGLNTKTK